MTDKNLDDINNAAIDWFQSYCSALDYKALQRTAIGIDQELERATDHSEAYARFNRAEFNLYKTIKDAFR